MRAPSHPRRDKRIDDETAIKEASRRLEPLFVDGISWSERGADTRKKFRTAIALVESALAEAERVLSKTVRVLNKTGKRALNKRTKGTIANAIANAVLRARRHLHHHDRMPADPGPHRARRLAVQEPRLRAGQAESARRPCPPR